MISLYTLTDATVDLEIKCWRTHGARNKGKKWQESGENYVMGSFIVLIVTD